MVKWIEDPSQLKLMVFLNIIDWELKISDYTKIKDGVTLMLLHKSPPKETTGLGQKSQIPG